MHPLPVSQRLHCKVESRDDGYLLKYEHLNHYVPLLHAKKKRGNLLHGGYHVEPAFDCTFLQSRGQGDLLHNWASGIQPRRLGCNQLQGDDLVSPKRKSSLFRQLRSALKPGHSHSVMDVSSLQNICFSPSGPADDGLADESKDCTLRRPVLAEIEGNSIMNRYRFRTCCSLFQDGILGSLNITTNYIKCQPRKLAIYLTGPGRSVQTSSGEEDLEEEQVKEEEEETNDVSLYSKDPDWNDRYQIYELDFGGRVNMDSIKNFQIERGGRVVSTHCPQ